MALINVNAKLVKGFPPIIGSKPDILILGTLPGKNSLKQLQYYADSGNSFWYIMEKLFGVSRYSSYDERCKALISNRVAVWDVLEQGDRKASQDKGIVEESAKANDFAAFFRGHPSIKTVFFNGKRTDGSPGLPRKYFNRLVLPHLTGTTVPSLEDLCGTSGVNSHYTKNEKVVEWRIALENARKNRDA